MNINLLHSLIFNTPSFVFISKNKPSNLKNLIFKFHSFPLTEDTLFQSNLPTLYLKLYSFYKDFESSTNAKGYI